MLPEFVQYLREVGFAFLRRIGLPQPVLVSFDARGDEVEIRCAEVAWRLFSGSAKRAQAL